MQVEFKGKFRRDLSKIKDKQVIRAVISAIENVEGASRIAQIQNLVKLKEYEVHYRIEIKGNYRIGVIIRGEKIWFVRVLHRNKIYKQFP